MKTRLFKSNKSQAVRLPKPVAFPDDVVDVEISIVGQTRVISPAARRWAAFFESPGVSDDFMSDRGQPAAQTRRAL